MNSSSVLAAIGMTAGLFALSCTGARPAHLGLKNGSLAPCPPAPNCVSSQSSDSQHRVEPLRFTSSRSSAVAGMKEVIRSMKRTCIVNEEESYLHAEFTSAVFRFVDDVEMYFDDDSKTIHIRSASRLGRSDFGVNRKRVDEIRKRWHQASRY